MIRSLAPLVLLTSLSACRPASFLEPNAFLPGFGRRHITVRGSAGPAETIWRHDLERPNASAHVMAVSREGRIAIAGANQGGAAGQCFIVVLERDGSPAWQTNWEGRCGFRDIVFRGEGVVVSFDRRAITSHGEALPTNAADAVVASFAPGGKPLWQTELASELEDESGPVTVDARGDVHAAVRLSGDRIVARGGDVDVCETTECKHGTTIMALDGESGSISSMIGFGLVMLLDIATIETDQGPARVVAGVYDGQQQVGTYADGRVERLFSLREGMGVFVARVEASGSMGWTRSFVTGPVGTGWFEMSPSLAVDPDGRIAVAANASEDRKRVSHVGVFSAEGAPLWEVAFETDPGDGDETALAWGPGGRLWMGGNFQKGSSYVDRPGQLALLELASHGAVLGSSSASRDNKLAPGPIAIDPAGRVIAADAEFSGKQGESPNEDIIVRAFGVAP